MKEKKICPKCGCKEIFYIPGQVHAYGAGNNIKTGITLSSLIAVDRYICSKCGYSEEWIRQEDLPKVKKKFG